MFLRCIAFFQNYSTRLFLLITLQFELHFLFFDALIIKWHCFYPLNRNSLPEHHKACSYKIYFLPELEKADINLTFAKSQVTANSLA